MFSFCCCKIFFGLTASVADKPCLLHHLNTKNKLATILRKNNKLLNKKSGRMLSFGNTV